MSRTNLAHGNCLAPIVNVGPVGRLFTRWPALPSRGVGGLTFGAFAFASAAAVVALKLPREALHVGKLVMASDKAHAE